MPIVVFYYYVKFKIKFNKVANRFVKLLFKIIKIKTIRGSRKFERVYANGIPPFATRRVLETLARLFSLTLNKSSDLLVFLNDSPTLIRQNLLPISFLHIFEKL